MALSALVLPYWKRANSRSALPIYLLATYPAWRDGFHELALTYAVILVEHAGQANPYSEANAYRWRARILADLGFRDRAMKDVARARAIGEQHPNLRDITEAGLLAVESLLCEDSDQAAELAGRSLTLLEDLENLVNLAAVHAVLARALIQSGRLEEAAVDLEAALDLYGKDRKSLPEGGEGGALGGVCHPATARKG